MVILPQRLVMLYHSSTDNMTYPVVVWVCSNSGGQRVHEPVHLCEWVAVHCGRQVATVRSDELAAGEKCNSSLWQCGTLAHDV